jgi:hypothetical protein
MDRLHSSTHTFLRRFSPKNLKGSTSKKSSAEREDHPPAKSKGTIGTQPQEIATSPATTESTSLTESNAPLSAQSRFSGSPASATPIDSTPSGNPLVTETSDLASIPSPKGKEPEDDISFEVSG